jgi:hypothetical protein
MYVSEYSEAKKTKGVQCKASKIRAEGAGERWRGGDEGRQFEQRNGLRK